MQSEEAIGGRELTPDIWRRVMFFLYREVPAAGSRPERRETRQGDLVTMMRVCTLFYDWAIPVLYTSVVSSDLNALLYTHPISSCSGRLAGKAFHLRRVKHLFIEHTDKSHIRPEDHNAINSAYHSELINLHQALSDPIFSTPSGPWPNLETLALCSIYPPDPKAWNSFCRSSLDPSRGRIMRELSERMPLLLSSGALQHICQRGGGGLLNFPPIINDPLPSSAMFTTHITTGEEYWTLTLGRPCQWILDPLSDPSSSILREAIESVLTLGSSMRPWQSQPTDQRILLDIYASGTDPQEGFNRRLDDSLPPGWRWEGTTAVFWDCLDGKDMQEAVKEIMEQMPECRTGKDEIRWLPGRKAKRCGSCGC